jgi:hypothetical protein
MIPDLLVEIMQDKQSKTLVEFIDNNAKIHDYLAMKLDFIKRGKLKLDMVDSVDNMIKEFPVELSPLKYPWNESLFKVKQVKK